MDCAIGEEFLEQELRKPSKKEKRGKGRKQCPKCGVYLAAASKECQDCGHTFYTVKIKKPKKFRTFKECDWKELDAGDTIYIINNDVWISPDKETVTMGESGEFEIVRKTREGLVLFSKTGYSFQDMVHTGYNSKTGITRYKPTIFCKGNAQ